ncbi:MAG TPA: DUF2177 family protein [Stellaceae bacterium]|jgi:uncharacterized membrane protein|nr:DUF2177 family protein [Stellaceae bacterium]
MRTTAIAYVATLAAIVAMDFCWLSLTGAKLYRPVLGDLLLPSPQIGAAIVFYLIYAAGVMILAVAPGVQAGSWPRALLHGAVLGFVAYGTYDLTNQATMKIWSTAITFADMAWGTVLTGTAASVGYWVSGQV